MANQRFTGSISLTSIELSPGMVRSTASMLVGQGGTNIKRMTTKVPGSHVRLFNKTIGLHEKCGVGECDSVLISARSAEDVHVIATMIKGDIQSLMDPCKNSSRPTLTVDCPTEAVGSVIGKGGGKLRDIQGAVGGNCFIRHDQGLGKFVVSSDDEDSLSDAKLHIENAIQKFDDMKHTWLPRPIKSDSDCDMEVACPGLKETEAERVQRELLSAMFKSSPVTNGMSERDRWSIRESLGNKLSADGSPVYKTYWGKAHQDVSTQCSGTHAVPWSEVDDEIERRHQAKPKRGKVADGTRTRKKPDAAGQCQARIWGDGSGRSRCSFTCVDGDFCKIHGKLAAVTSEPCQNDEGGRKIGLYFGRYDSWQDGEDGVMPYKDSHGVIRIAWNSDEMRARVQSDLTTGDATLG